MHTMELKLVLQLFLKDLEVGSIDFVHKHIHKKWCCGVSLYNTQKEHLDWEIILKWNSFLLRYSTLLRSLY